VIPPKANAALVAAMEDVLDVYTRPHDPERPLVCLDETSKQLVAETRQPLALRRGQPARYDYEYKRGGTANLFMLFAPLEGFRHVAVTERRTAIDYAHILRDLADIHFPRAEKIVLVQDNLNTHTPASLYEAFASRSPAHRRTLRVARHAQAWQLAQSGGVGTGRAIGTVSRPPHPRRRETEGRGRGLV
jgi:hypothetical protein